jgi:hypothetical protein
MIQIASMETKSGICMVKYIEKMDLHASMLMDPSGGG